MSSSRGIAYCGLACFLCGHSDDCPGCRHEGCSNKEWCKSYSCCKEMGIDGCWQCSEFPCDANPMLSKPKIRAFIRFITEHGQEKFIKATKKSQTDGMVYHYKGGIIGDYDKPETEDEIIELIKIGL